MRTFTLWLAAILAFGGARLSGAAPAAPILATYDRAILETQVRADHHRHMDTAATIARIRAVHATAYFCPVRSSLNWDDLTQEFLPAAAAAGLEVWVYLLPPTESKAGSMTFGHDYVQWAAEIARLSLRYPNLKGFSIDDFGYNLELFTPQYIGRLRTTAHAINAGMKFYPLLYWKSIEPKFLDTYAPVIDGAILAFRDEPTISTSRVGALRHQLDVTERLLAARGKPLLLMPYCWPLDRIPIPPSVDYVRDIVTAGLGDMRAGKLEGIVTYELPLSPLPAAAAENYAHSGNGRVSILVSGVKIPIGSFGEVSRSVAVSPAPGPRRLGFWRWSTSQPVRPDVCFLQVLVDDTVVWEQDAAVGQSRTWSHETVDLAAALAGKASAVLRLRVAVKSLAPGTALIGGFDDLEPEGLTVADPGFESAAGWQPRQNSRALMPMIQIFDPQRPIQMYEAVKTLYSNRRSDAQP